MACVEYLIGFICFRNQLCREKLFNIKDIFRVRIRKIFIVGVFGDVVFILGERRHTSKLQDTLADVQNGQLVNGCKLFPEFLVV